MNAISTSDVKEIQKCNLIVYIHSPSVMWMNKCKSWLTCIYSVFFYISVYEVHFLGQIKLSKFKTCVPKMYFCQEFSF